MMTEARVVPRLSASVILVRDGEHGFETFMVQRHAKSPVAPSAYVFPGGTVRDDDDYLDSGVPEASRTLLARSDTPLESSLVAAVYACAVRELFEEAGVLLADVAGAGAIEVNGADQAFQERLASARLARDISLRDLLTDLGMRPAFETLVPFSHWVTPVALAARFDAYFFVAEMPLGQEALHCTIETSEGVWLTPSQVLDGDYQIVFATAQHLRRIAPFARVADLVEFARAKAIRRIQPELVESGSGVSVVLPPDLVDDW
jgi:8-oxo-dGTP pyrophosphatase MutT (NUDIX family)